MRALYVMLGLVLGLLGDSAVMAQSGHVMLGAEEIKWGAAPPSLPRGAMLAVVEGKPSEPGPFTMRLKFPAGFRVAPHFHPAIEHLTVLSGTIHFGMGDTFDAGKLTPMRAGSFIVMPVGTSHFVEAKEETVVQVHGVGPWGSSTSTRRTIRARSSRVVGHFGWEARQKEDSLRRPQVVFALLSRQAL